MAENLTVEILREIRDELRTTRTELSDRLDQVRTELSNRLDITNERIGHLEGTMVEIAEPQRFLVRRMKADAKRAGTADRDTATLKRRLDTLESRIDKLER